MCVVASEETCSGRGEGRSAGEERGRRGILRRGGLRWTRRARCGFSLRFAFLASGAMIGGFRGAAAAGVGAGGARFYRAGQLYFGRGGRPGNLQRMAGT